MPGGDAGLPGSAGDGGDAGGPAAIRCRVVTDQELARGSELAGGHAGGDAIAFLGGEVTVEDIGAMRGGAVEPGVGGLAVAGDANSVFVELAEGTRSKGAAA